MTTKEKLINFWDYHKVYIIAGILAVIFVIFTVSECMSNKTPDISIGFIASEYKDTEKLEKMLSETLGDRNGDGVSYAFCDNVLLPKTPQNDGDAMLIQKVSVMFASGDYQMFIMDKEFFEADIYGEMFVDISDIITEEMAEDSVKMRGKSVAFKTTHSKFLNDAGVSGENLYLGLIVIRESDKGKEKMELLHKISEDVLKEVIINK